jgi:thioredoxin 1
LKRGYNAPFLLPQGLAQMPLLFSPFRIAFLSGLLTMSACANQAGQSLTNNNPQHHHSIKASEDMNRVGSITMEELLSGYPKFADKMQASTPDANDTLLFQKLEGYDLVVVFGLWCHDSQREVPRLLKLIEQSQVKLNSLQLVAINQQKELPIELSSQYAIQFTPTIFVAKEGQILAKLVEKPKQSLAKDLLSQILH